MAKKDKITKNSQDESEIVRKFKQNPGLYIGSVVVLVLVGIAFVVPSEVFTGKSNTWDNTFGYYDKVPIKYVPDNMFAQYQRNAVQYYQSMGYDLSNEWLAAQVWRQAYEWTVLHTAVLQVMKRSNYAIPVKTVDREVAKLPQFQENGRFSASLYRQMPESSRLALWRQVQEELTREIYINEIRDGLLMTMAEAEFIGKMASPERNFNVVLFNIDDYPESEYKAYALSNARLFDSVHLSKITINSNEREANKILDSINSGVITYEDAARTQSQDYFADRGGDMGVRFVYDLEFEFNSSDDLDKVINMRAGTVSPVIKSGETWVIYRAEEEIIKADFEEDSVMERVRSYLRNYNRGIMEDWAMDQANAFVSLASENGFEKAAITQEKEIYNMGPFPINFGSVELFKSLDSNPVPAFSNQDIDLLSRNESFWKTAFSTDLNTPSEPFVQGNNILVLLPVEETNVEETAAMDAASRYLTEWLTTLTDRSLQYYFLFNERMDDRFAEVFY